jgi:hypothetical protein
MAHVLALVHTDFHHCSRQVVLPTGEWATPVLFGLLDDHSRLGCHAQWYLRETAENLVHGLWQGFQKRGLPRALMEDNGSAMTAGETVQGIRRLGIILANTLEYSPYQNGKMEAFWFSVENRLLAMLEGVKDLTLPLLNDATLAWLEFEYNRKVHSETGETPIARFMNGSDVGRPAPGSEVLRQAFGLQASRKQRRSDGTITVKKVRFEVPSSYRHLERLTIRYSRWDLSSVYMIDPRTNAVLCRLLPLDKERNASGQRRMHTSLADSSAVGLTEPPESGIAPLLREHMAEYSATGLPPAYIHKDESSPAPQGDEEEGDPDEE